MEQGVAAAGPHAGRCHHARRLLRLDPVDDLHVVHPQPPLSRLPHRSRGLVAAVRPPVRRRRLGDLAEEPGRACGRQRARHRPRLHPRRDDQSREARRGLLPHDLPLSARHIADRHRPRLALDVQSRARHRELPARDSASTSANFNWLAEPDTAMYGIILASIWQSGRLLHGADARRAEVDQHRDLERGHGSTA